MAIEKVDYVWMDGDFIKWNDACVHVMTHCLHYGTGVFEGIRAYPVEGGLNVFRLDDHLKRLFNSAKVHKIEVPYTQTQLREIILDLIRKNRLKSPSYIRPIVFRGFGEFGLNPMGTPIKCAVVVFPIKAYLKEEGVRVCTSSWRRIPDECMPASAKTCGAYVNSVLAKIEAVEKGYDEAVMLDIHGYLAEGTGENLFIVKDSQIFTPPLSTSILEGITRSSMIDLARDEGFQVFELNLLKSALYTCEEAFFTGTAAEVTPILSVDDRMIKDGVIGEVTRKLKRKFSDVVQGKVEKYRKWLIPVY